MEFPFKFKHVSGYTIYTANNIDGDLVVTWDEGGVEKANPYYTVERAQKYIDEGTWIVQEPELVFPVVVMSSLGSLYTLTKGTSGVNVWSHQCHGTYHNHVSEDEAKEFIESGVWVIQKPVEAPVEPSAEVSKLTIKVESEGAVEAVKELTEAINELGYAYSKLIEIQSRFKGN